MGKPYSESLKVLSLVDRTSGKARSFKVDAVDGRTIIPIIRKNVAKETMMVTDEPGRWLRRSRDRAAQQERI
jgi:hypothetical protein